ncbi:MAG: hypothetical protein ACRD44_06070 [Bryobacteraceae bacterium]
MSRSDHERAAQHQFDAGSFLQYKLTSTYSGSNYRAGGGAGSRPDRDAFSAGLRGAYCRAYAAKDCGSDGGPARSAA